MPGRSPWLMRGASDRPDWRDAAAYAPLLEADRSLFAWEWLRRGPDYRSAAKRSLEGPGGPARLGPEEFGLVQFEPPCLAVPHARPLWRSDIYPYVLGVGPCGLESPDDWFDVSGLAPLATLIRSRGLDHLLLSDGFRAIRLDGPSGLFGSGPVCLCYRIAGTSSARRPLMTLQRLLMLHASGRFARSLHAREARARRWIMVLRASDALATGSTQREIAGELLSATVKNPSWRDRESSVRSQVQRLVKAASEFGRGGFWSLLS